MRRWLYSSLEMCNIYLACGGCVKGLCQRFFLTLTKSIISGTSLFLYCYRSIFVIVKEVMVVLAISSRCQSLSAIPAMLDSMTSFMTACICGQFYTFLGLWPVLCQPGTDASFMPAWCCDHCHANLVL